MIDAQTLLTLWAGGALASLWLGLFVITAGADHPADQKMKWVLALIAMTWPVALPVVTVMTFWMHD